jgi:hypothetical protein
MTQTVWGQGTNGPIFPAVFTKFDLDPSLYTLDSVAITMSGTVTNTYEIIFVNTPTPTTITVQNSSASNPNVAPTFTLYAPDGLTQIFGGPGASVPVDEVSRTSSVASVYSSSPSDGLGDKSPYYIPPTVATISLSSSIDSSHDAPLLPEFIGTGTINVIAFSSFTSNSGNGGGAVTTDASAIVTLQYFYTVIPEPSSLILLGLRAGLGLLAAGRGRRAARPAVNDRA